MIVLSYQHFCYAGAYITIYSSCIPKGRVHMPFSLREMIEKVKYSKVKLYKGVDIDLKVHETTQLSSQLPSVNFMLLR